MDFDQKIKLQIKKFTKCIFYDAVCNCGVFYILQLKCYQILKH